MARCTRISRLVVGRRLYATTSWLSSIRASTRPSASSSAPAPNAEDTVDWVKEGFQTTLALMQETGSRAAVVRT